MESKAMLHETDGKNARDRLAYLHILNGFRPDLVTTEDLDRTELFPRSVTRVLYVAEPRLTKSASYATPRYFHSPNYSGLTKNFALQPHAGLTLVLKGKAQAKVLVVEYYGYTVWADVPSIAEWLDAKAVGYALSLRERASIAVSKITLKVYERNLDLQLALKNHGYRYAKEAKDSYYLFEKTLDRASVRE